jgi:hypothetical protein
MSTFRGKGSRDRSKIKVRPEGVIEMKFVPNAFCAAEDRMLMLFWIPILLREFAFSTDDRYGLSFTHKLPFCGHLSTECVLLSTLCGRRDHCEPSSGCKNAHSWNEKTLTGCICHFEIVCPFLYDSDLFMYYILVRRAVDSWGDDVLLHYYTIHDTHVESGDGSTVFHCNAL